MGIRQRKQLRSPRSSGASQGSILSLRSQPAFQIVPGTIPRLRDPGDESLYHAAAVGRSSDGLTAADRDEPI
jgi:hypothetical protein